MKRKVLTLPSNFRPTNLWGLLITHNDKPIASFELKSHFGPSFGHNFNNRCEEAIGTAHDFATAYREGTFGNCTSPFTGWLILIEGAEKSRLAVKDKAPHHPVFSENRDPSYADRYDIPCRKMIK